MGNERADQLVLGFVATVTLYFLALVFAGAAGERGVAQVVVFGFGAAFGLEFLWTAWTRLWEPGDGGSIG
jgi:NhaP-type Na+/H+ or K+/H+ antiporter